MAGGFGPSDRRFAPIGMAESAAKTSFGRTRRLPVEAHPGTMSILEIGTTRGCAHDVSFGFGGLG